MEDDRPKRLDSEWRATLRTAGPLMLVVGGSGIAPLPCAFSLAGIPAGIVVVILVALINDYTSIMLVQAAVATRKYGYEEVMAAVGGRGEREQGDRGPLGQAQEHDQRPRSREAKRPKDIAVCNRRRAGQEQRAASNDRWPLACAEKPARRDEGHRDRD